MRKIITQLRRGGQDLRCQFTVHQEFCGACMTCSRSFPLLGPGRLLTLLWQNFVVFFFFIQYVLSCLLVFCGCSGVVGCPLSIPEIAYSIQRLCLKDLSMLDVRLWNDHALMPITDSSSKKLQKLIIKSVTDSFFPYFYETVFAQKSHCSKHEIFI